MRFWLNLLAFVCGPLSKTEPTRVTLLRRSLVIVAPGVLQKPVRHDAMLSKLT